jgi:hypothetical protein
MIKEISQPHFLQSISEVERIPFSKEDVYQVIRMHPGISGRNILTYLGLSVSSLTDHQRISSFVYHVMADTKKLRNEGRIRIVERTDRFEYYAVGEERGGYQR